MRIRRRGTRLAVRGQLTVIAMVIMTVVFLILTAVTQNISTAQQQNQQTTQASSGENLAQTAAAWLTNHLNSDPNYIMDGSGPFSIGGAYTPPAGSSSVTHSFDSEWFQFDASGHYQGCNTNLVQPCVRFDPATARFSTAYNPASTAIPTSLEEENVVATVEVEQNCAGIASGCKDSYYSTTIARRGYYNYLAFTNYATLDPAQYSPLGLVNPGSVCQTNNAASGCVPVSYQANGTPSPNGIFGGGGDTAPVFNGTSDHVSAPLQSISGSFTVEAWFNLGNGSNANGGEELFSTRQPQDASFDMQASSSGLHGDVGNGTGWITTAANASLNIPLGVWEQAVYAVTPTGVSIYFNGAEVASYSWSSQSTLLSNANHQAEIGALSGTAQLFNGAIGEVSVYSTALTSTQILDQYNAAAAGTYDAVTAADSPVAWWKLSEPVGATSAQDSSGNGYTGTYSSPISVVVPGPFAGSGQATITQSTANNGDSIYGALRTNSPTIFVCDGNSSAFDVPLVQATSAQVMTATQPGCGLPSSATTTAQRVSPMAMPTNVSALAQASYPYIFPDGTSFDFTPNGMNISFTGSSSYMTNNWPALDSALIAANTVVLVSGASVSIQNMAIPANGVLYVNGSVSNVVGVVNGQVTIAAEGNVDVNAQPDPTVGDNLYYYCNGQGAVNPQVIASGCTDLLGLDAQGSIAIGPQQYDETGWSYNGTGSPAWFTWAYSQIVTVTPGATYTVSAAINATSVTAGNPCIGVFNPTFTVGYVVAYQNPGNNGVVSATVTIPQGVTQVRVIEDTDDATVTAGQQVTWSNPVFTLSGSSTNLLEPSNQWSIAGAGSQGSGPGDFENTAAQLPPTVVDAAMTALGNSPGVANSNGSIYGSQWQTPNPSLQNPSCVIDAPDLTINGAMISQYQGTFGQYLGLYPSTNPCLISGYHKHFFWDSRLAYQQPPFALSPGSANFVEMGLNVIS